MSKKIDKTGEDGEIVIYEDAIYTWYQEKWVNRMTVENPKNVVACEE